MGPKSNVLGCCMSFKVRSELYATHDGVEAEALNKILEEGAGGVVISGGDVVQQKVAIHHVVHKIYSYAPVKKQLLKYPKTSKRYGQEYIWLSLNDEAVDRLNNCEGEEVQDVLPEVGKTNWEKAKLDFPPGVSVDSQGNIYVAAREGEQARKISCEDVMASFRKPSQPSAPTVVESHPESLRIEWTPVLGLVEAYEIQYKVVDNGQQCAQCGEAQDPSSESPTCERCCYELAPIVASQAFLNSRRWETVRMQDAKKACGSLIDSIQCNVPYLFRIRARNEMGFSEFSEPSSEACTLPEKPAEPDNVYLICAFENSLAVKWKQPEANGSPILLYRVRGAPILRDAESSDQFEELPILYDGSQNFVVFQKLRPDTEYQYQVCAENAVGSSTFGQPATFRTIKDRKDTSGDKEFKQEWFELWDSFSNQLIYLNARTGTQLLERPAEMDGPVDFMLEFKKKRFRFLRELLVNAPKSAIDVVRLKINRDNMILDSLAALQGISAEQWVKKIRIDFLGEEGIDSGGLSKDWFLEVSRWIFRPELGLFVEVNETNTYEIDKDCAPTEEKLNLFYLVGLFLGKAIYDRQLIDVRLSTLLLKQLLGYEVNIDDLQETDPEFVKSMNWMLKNDIEDVIYEEFAVTVKEEGGSGAPKLVVHDLIPEGRNIEVTDENKELYVEKKMEWRAVGSMAKQVDSMKHGLFQIIPLQLLNQFSIKELELLWNGSPEVDLVALRASTIYQGDIDINSEIVQWFWKAFKDFDQEQTNLLLRFVTGTSKIPLDAFDPPFNITYSPDKDVESLPEAHTCFNQIVLPNYPDYHTLWTKLMFAIENSVGFGRS